MEERIKGNGKIEEIQDSKEDPDQLRDDNQINSDKEEALRKMSVVTEEGKINDKEKEEKNDDTNGK